MVVVVDGYCSGSGSSGSSSSMVMVHCILYVVMVWYMCVHDVVYGHGMVNDAHGMVCV